jgi:type I restriction-modification system DNA methylase subunit
LGEFALAEGKKGGPFYTPRSVQRKDSRWKFGRPPAGKANYAWIQHFLYHLSPSGIAGFVLAKGSPTSKSSKASRTYS